MEETMEFEIVKHHPTERKYIILKPLKKSFFDSVAGLLSKNR